MTLDQYVAAEQALVDATLETCVPAESVPPATIHRAMRYSLFAGGKRIRPLLCMAAARAVSDAPVGIEHAACALEMIHTYSLIHDDLPAMDNDTLRRGQPTLHVVAGEGMAILAGDGLLTEAFALIARDPPSVDPIVIARKLRVVAIVASGAGAAGMVGGQAIDLASVTPRNGSVPVPLGADDVRDMHARKTGALIRASACAGAVMGGGSDGEVDAIDRAASEFGLAFQIVDDVLDVEGASAELGKTAGKDVAAGKPTYPALYGLERSKQMARECLERATEILSRIHLADSRLVQIGGWIVNRTH
jgi:geranylgeranyl diphosphate synthase type II